MCVALGFLERLKPMVVGPVGYGSGDDLPMHSILLFHRMPFDRGPRSVPCSTRVSLSVQASSADEDSNYWTKMMSVIRGEIQEYRSELDALTMKRTQMERKLKQVWRACD